MKRPPSPLMQALEIILHNILATYNMKEVLVEEVYTNIVTRFESSLKAAGASYTKARARNFI